MLVLSRQIVLGRRQRTRVFIILILIIFLLSDSANAFRPRDLLGRHLYILLDMRCTHTLGKLISGLRDVLFLCVNNIILSKLGINTKCRSWMRTDQPSLVTLTLRRFTLLFVAAILSRPSFGKVSALIIKICLDLTHFRKWV